MKKEASLSIIEDSKTRKVLMIRNHRGINKGCVNFPGGKKEQNETMQECVCRETLEETGLKIENPIQVGYVEFPKFDFFVSIFKSTKFSGTLIENQQEVEAFWVDLDKIPYDQMRAADRDFVPDILKGKYVKRQYVYDENFSLKNIIEIE